MSYKYNPVTDKFEHIPDEQSHTAYISTNTTCPSQVYQIVYLADECIDKIADVVVKKMQSFDDGK